MIPKKKSSHSARKRLPQSRLRRGIVTPYINTSPELPWDICGIYGKVSQCEASILRWGLIEDPARTSTSHHVCRQACRLDAGRNAGWIQASRQHAGLMQTSWLDACSQLMQASSWRQDVAKLALNMGIVTTTRENNIIRAINSSM